MKSPEALINLYRQKGMRITPQRRMIFELLFADKTHPTVDDVYQRLREDLPDISLTTVYNTINELVALGELHDIEGLHGGATRYDTSTEPHHHLYCTECQNIVDLRQEIELLKLLPHETTSFQIKRVQVTYYGLCEDCKNGGSSL